MKAKYLIILDNENKIVKTIPIPIELEVNHTEVLTSEEFDELKLESLSDFACTD